MENKWEYDVCIVGGLGHVGLPFGLAIADAGKRVVLNDINDAARQLVESGKMPFRENGAEQVLARVLNKTLSISLDPNVISKAKIVVIVIGTPVDEHLNPNFTQFLKFFAGCMPHIRDGQHIMLRSTIFPGTTEKVAQLFEKSGKKIGLSFCPERVVEGKALDEIAGFPQIISAFTEESYNTAEGLFKILTGTIIRLVPMEAELAKLYTNTWRYISFAIANQFYQISLKNGVDFYRIHHALTHEYPRAKDFPKAGFAAGPCLFKDTMQLAAFSNNVFFLGHAAMLVNEGLPNFIIDTLKAKLPIRNKKIGILGMAFKANSDDKRESLSYKVKKMLSSECETVLCSDIYIKEDGFISTEELIARSDIIILGVPHAEYLRLAIPEDKMLVDIWNAFQRGGIF